MKSLKKFFALCLTLALVLSLAACAQKPAETTDPAETPDTPAQETEAPVTARIAALKGPTAMGLVKLMSDAPSSANGPLYDFTLAGSADEVTPALIKGELDMACVPANLAAVLYNKTEGAVQVLAVNTLGVLYIVENGESVQSLADLKGKTVCVGDVGSGTALNAAQVLEAYDMTFDDIKVMYDSFSGGAEALKNGQCDAAFTVSGAPTPALTDLATAYNFNMPSLSDEAVSYLTTNYPFLVQDNLPANTYTCVADETVCVAVKAVFTASKDLSEDVVYEITKAMFDNQADLAKAQAKFGYLSPEGAVAGSFDLHPGAEKYYKEIGVL